jgi:hypothetical protein
VGGLVSAVASGLPSGGCVLLMALPSTPTRRSLNPPRGSHKQALVRRYAQVAQPLQWIRVTANPCSDASSALLTGLIFNMLFQSART